MWRGGPAESALRAIACRTVAGICMFESARDSRFSALQIQAPNAAMCIRSLMFQLTAVMPLPGLLAAVMAMSYVGDSERDSASEGQRCEGRLERSAPQRQQWAAKSNSRSMRPLRWPRHQNC